MIHIRKIILESFFPAMDCISAIHLCPAGEPGPNIMPMVFLGCIKGKILYQEWSWSNHCHIALDDIQKLRELIEGGRTENAPKFCKTNIVRKEIPVLVLRVGHRPELVKLKNFFIFSGPILGKKDRRSEFHSYKDRSHEQNRGENNESSSREKRIKKPLDKPLIRTIWLVPIRFCK